MKIGLASFLVFCLSCMSSCKDNQFLGGVSQEARRSTAQQGSSVPESLEPGESIPSSSEPSDPLDKDETGGAGESLPDPTISSPVASDPDSSCAGTRLNGFCWYSAPKGQSCQAFCTNHGGYHEATRTFAGYPGGTPAQCLAVHKALKTYGDKLNIGDDADMGPTQAQNYCGDAGTTNMTSSSGCANNYSSYWKGARFYCRKKSGTTAAASSTSLRRICACQK